VPFNVQIPEREQDKRLIDKLRAELPGILNWAMAGCLAWQRDGLGAPQEVTEATAAYRAEMDEIGGFIDERCVLNRRAVVPAADLYSTYSKWCEASGEKPLTQRIFGMKLTERGLTRKRLGAAMRWHWAGIELRTDMKPPLQEPERQTQQTETDRATHKFDLVSPHEGKTSVQGSVGSVESVESIDYTEELRAGSAGARRS
jgi:putative DNA primase/helicase